MFEMVFHFVFLDVMIYYYSIKTTISGYDFRYKVKIIVTNRDFPWKLKQQLLIMILTCDGKVVW